MFICINTSAVPSFVDIFLRKKGNIEEFIQFSFLMFKTDVQPMFIKLHCVRLLLNLNNSFGVLREFLKKLQISRGCMSGFCF